MQRTCWTSEYLLAHCERYRVESDVGTLGYVDEVILSADGREALGLLVRTGDRGCVRIGIEEVLELHPSGERIVVRADRLAPAAGETGDQASCAAPERRRATPDSSAARATASATARATSRLKTLGIT
jgi:hypothetical protein